MIITAKLITIDSSTNKSGIAYFCNGKYETHYLLDYSKNKNIDNRFDDMSHAIWNLLEKHNPNILYIEETYAAVNPQTTKILTRLQGVVYAWCMAHDCNFNTIRPSSWRKQLNFTQGKGIKREHLKEQSVKYVFDNYNLNVGDDEADAICIGDAIIKKFGEKNE